MTKRPRRLRAAAAHRLRVNRPACRMVTAPGRHDFIYSDAQGAVDHTNSDTRPELSNQNRDACSGAAGRPSERYARTSFRRSSTFWRSLRNARPCASIADDLLDLLDQLSGSAGADRFVQPAALRALLDGVNSWRQSEPRHLGGIDHQPRHLRSRGTREMRRRIDVPGYR